MTTDSHPFNEAGRRLKAALLSYVMGRPGVDATLNEIPKDVGEGWAEMAKHLIDEMVITNTKSNAESPSGPFRIK